MTVHLPVMVASMSRRRRRRSRRRSDDEEDAVPDPACQKVASSGLGLGTLSLVDCSGSWLP